MTGYITLTRNVAKMAPEILYHKGILLGFRTFKENGMKTGKIELALDEKIPGVFGDYSSLGVAIGLSFEGDVESFEKEIDKFTPRLVNKIQSMANEIAAQSGVPAIWNKKEQK